LSARKGKLVADFRNEFVGVDSDRLGVGSYRRDGDAEIVDRSQIRYSVGEQGNEFDG